MASSHLLIVAMKGTIPSFPKPGRLAKNLARGVCFGARSLQPQWNRCSKKKLIFQPRCFRCYASLREGMSCAKIMGHRFTSWRSLTILAHLQNTLRTIYVHLPISVNCKEHPSNEFGHISTLTSPCREKCLFSALPSTTSIPQHLFLRIQTWIIPSAASQRCDAFSVRRSRFRWEGKGHAWSLNSLKLIRF